MKRILIILVLILRCSSLFAQYDNYAFVDSSLWYQHSVFVTKPGSSLPPTNHQGYRNFILLNDTSSSETNVQKLIASDQSWSIDKPTYGFFKKEDNKVFFKKPSESWKVIYDYSLAVGDTFVFNLIKRPPYVDSSVVNLKVLKVDSILINQRYRKRITFESFAYGVRPVWVEGVGDYNYGLIDEYGYIINNAGLGGSSKILCFNEGLIQIVGNCKIENAGTVSELVKELDMGTKFEVYPTIFDNTINIDSDLPKEFNRIHLINSKGAIVFKGDFKELVNYSFENLQDGIYTIVIFGGESSLVKRIVKKKW